MATPRLLIAAALLACGAAAALTGCTPADSGSTLAAASAAARADEGADELLDDDEFFYEDDEESYAPEADPSVPASATVPSAECATPTALPGHQVLLVVSAGPAELTARPARFGCGSGRYEPAGSPVHYGYAGAGVAATLVDGPHDGPAGTVPLAELISHVNDCLADREPAGPAEPSAPAEPTEPSAPADPTDPAEPYGCHGDAYDVVLDSHGRIMRIGEIDDPPQAP
ncbi:hypothetical protein ACWD4P_20390 [Kitasatospora sp. NPDC002543]